MRRLDSKKAFTLIELLVVIAILGVLVLLAAPRFLGQTEEALHTSLVHDARLIQDASNRYYLDNGEFPYLLNESGEKTLIGPNGLFEVLYKVEDFDDDNMNVNFYEIDFEKLDSYVQVNNDHGYFVAAVGNPEFGITALEPGDRLTSDRLENNGGQNSGGSGATIVDSPIPPKNNGHTIWKGLDANAFDGNESTLTTIPTTSSEEVTWEGDLTNNIISLVVRTANSGTLASSISMTIYDKDGNQLDFINADNDKRLSKYTLSDRSRVTGRLNFIMPKNADKLSFISDRRAGSVLDITDYEDKKLPSPIREITSEDGRHQVALSWDKYYDEDFERVAVYRDDEFVGYSYDNKYIDKPLYSDKEYNYTVQVVDKTGNRSEKSHYTTRTIIDGVVWRGLTPNAFDGNESTLSEISGSVRQDVTWDRDLTNNIISLTVRNGMSGTLASSISMTIYDKDGNALDFINADTDERLSKYTLSSRSRVTGRLNFIMPENAEKLSFISDRRAGNVLDITDHEDKSLPLPVRNISSQDGRHQVTLNWNNPNNEDFERVAVYRDDEFIGYSYDNKYVDTPLYSDKEYRYSLQVVDQTGNRSKKVNYSTKTIVDGAVWKGLTPNAFDGNESTSTNISMENSQDVTWEGDLTDSTISLVVRTAMSGTLSSSISMTIHDRDGNQLDFINTDTNEILNKYTLSSRQRVTGRLNFIMPENAEKLSFISGNRVGSVLDITD